MTIRCWPLTIAVLLMGCEDKPDQLPFEANTSTPSRVEIYQRGDGRDSVGCTSTPDRDVCSSREEFGYLFADCSDNEFECVFNEDNVFAVPKMGFVAGQKYSVFGATLTVERCFGEKNTCKVAMISSMCADDAVCSCRLAEIGKTKAIFYYSTELGVTAFYATAPKVQEGGSKSTFDAGELDDAIPLRTYVLASRSGFLREHWNIRKAKFKTQCPP
jgi:hypothetical protein